MKLAAAAAGLDIVEYTLLIELGHRRCTRCKTWKLREEFGNDRSRADGCDRSCRQCRRKPNPSTAHLFRKGRESEFKGKRHTDEAKAEISAKLKGRQFRLGKKHTPETIAKMKAAERPRGEQHYNYQHGRAQRNLDGRRTVEYFEWRDAVFKRDKYTCRKCGDDKGGNLRAHHILPFATHPELRYAVDNGLTLCHPCHELEHFKPDSVRNQRKLKRGERLWE